MSIVMSMKFTPQKLIAVSKLLIVLLIISLFFGHNKSELDHRYYCLRGFDHFFSGQDHFFSG